MDIDNVPIIFHGVQTLARVLRTGQPDLETIADPALKATNVRLKVGMVGFCCW
jgi:hypothetical protein